MHANSHYGLVADCRDCDGQLIEEHRTWPDDRVHVGLLCHDCGHSATVEWGTGEDPLEVAETSEPLDDLQVREIQWIDCRTCHGAGTVPEWGIRSGRRSCPNCFRSGKMPRLPATDGGQSAGGTGRTAVIELTASEARDTHLAASKEGRDRDGEAMQELSRAYGGDDAEGPEDYPSGKMRFIGDPQALCDIAMKVQSHGKNRREKGHSASQSKYYSIGDKIESQLVRQGEWVENGNRRGTGGDQQ